MLFDVISLDRFGNPQKHVYDNLTQDVRDSNGTLVEFWTDPKFKPYFQRPRNEHYFAPHLHHLTSLKIQLGLACNYHCSYCNQEKSRRLTEKRVHLPDSLRIKNLLKVFEKKRIEPANVALWGGEPLVYWKTIERIVPAIEEYFGGMNFSIFTNGSLLDDAKVDFCLEHNITVTLSHDAQAFEHYRNDVNPLDDEKILRAIERYRAGLHGDMEFGINVVVSPENADLFEVERYFVNRFGDDISYNFEGIVRLDYTNDGVITPFDAKTAKVLTDSIKAFGTTTPSHSSIPQLVNQTVANLVNRRDSRDIPTYCSVGSDRVLNITLDGDMLACHGASPDVYTFAHIKDYGTAVNDRIIPWWTRGKCATCPILRSCLGGCAILQDAEQPKICENELLWNLSVFWCAWWKLFDGARILSITPSGQS